MQGFVSGHWHPRANTAPWPGPKSLRSAASSRPAKARLKGSIQAGAGDPSWGHLLACSVLLPRQWLGWRKALPEDLDKAGSPCSPSSSPDCGGPTPWLRPSLPLGRRERLPWPACLHQVAWFSPGWLNAIDAVATFQGRPCRLAEQSLRWESTATGCGVTQASSSSSAVDCMKLSGDALLLFLTWHVPEASEAFRVDL